MLAGEQVVLPGNDLGALPLLGSDLGDGEPPKGRVLGHREDMLHLAQPGVDALADRDPMPPGRPLELVDPPREVALLLLHSGGAVFTHAHAPAPSIGRTFGVARVVSTGGADKKKRAPDLRLTPSFSSAFGAGR